MSRMLSRRRLLQSAAVFPAAAATDPALAHDERDAIQSSLDDLPVIDIHSL